MKLPQPISALRPLEGHIALGGGSDGALRRPRRVTAAQWNDGLQVRSPGFSRPDALSGQAVGAFQPSCSAYGLPAEAGTPYPLVPPALRGRQRAFTLMELLIVLAIMGILAAVALPAMKGLQKSNSIANATQQLLSDLALARQTAIREQTTVHVIFVPPLPDLRTMTPSAAGNPVGFRDRNTWTNLLTHPYSGYALFVERSVGDQPGSDQWHARYIGPWRFLPDGIIIAEREFVPMFGTTWDTTPEVDRSFKVRELPGFPFPTVHGNRYRVPHLSFNSKGGLLVTDSRGNIVPEDEVISLARASVFAVRDPMGQISDFDVRETPPGNSISNYNRIRIDGLTGRARVEQPQIQ